MKVKIVYLALLAMAASSFAASGFAAEGRAVEAAAKNSGEAVGPRKVVLSEGWQIQQSGKAGVNGRSVGGEVLSTPKANVEGWYAAHVPSTVMGALTVDNGMYEDLFYGTNYKAADRTPFDESWWYRTSFDLAGVEGKHVSLNFDGISYRANIWLNGKLVASKDEVFGVFCRHSFDITDLLQKHNTLAVEVFRAQKGEPNNGFVDWNPRPLDEGMGIFRPVWLGITGDVELKNTRVQSMLNTGTLREAFLNISTEVANLTENNIEGELVGKIEGIEFSLPVTLSPGEKREVRITSDDVKGLHLRNPRVWWCTGLGEPEMYDLDIRFVVGGKVSGRFRRVRRCLLGSAT